MKILVTGCRGMLGQAVMRRLAAAHQLTGIDLEDGDLTDPAAAADLVAAAGCEWVVHCAAWTDVDGAESAREQALAVNAGATENLVRGCGPRGVGLCYVSTDYVFAGDGGDQGDGYNEDEPRNPVNYYGLTKARGEEIVAAAQSPWQIVRTSWLFGDGPVNFIKTIRRLLETRKRLRVVDDQRGCPTYAEDLADIIGFLVSGRHRGIFHGTNSGVTTWYELARQVAIAGGADPDRIYPCPSSEYPTPTVRPACSVLHSSRLEQAGYPARPDWRDALGRYISLLESGQAAHP